MWRRFRNPKLYLMIAIDACAFAIALIGGYLMRLDFALEARHFEQIRQILIISIPLKLAIFFGFGLYRGMWRYTGLRDVFQVLKASVVGTIGVIAIMVYKARFADLSRAVFVLDAMFTFIMTASVRSATRIFFNWKLSLFPSRHREKKSKRTKVIIIGAGDAGARIVNEIQDSASPYFPICFLDDSPSKIGRSLHGVPIVGPISDLALAVEKYKAGEIFIAVPSASGTEMRSIVSLCEITNIPFKTLPTLGEIMNGTVSIKELRDVDYHDLLGRKPVELDTEGISDYLKGKVVLITGCGGSIGSELCRQVIRFKPSQLILYDACEFNLYQIEMELLQELKFNAYVTVLGRVQDSNLTEKIFERYRPQVVFHAAAYKHVPMLEKNPWEAILNNIEGSVVVMNAAVKHAAERFLLVSTDKAVRPTNVMGATKRTTELFMRSLSSASTKFMAVRFGNVLGSAGSVVPLFRRQIERGGPVTVTHPDVTRYFMTIPEATQLILQAGSMGEGGEIFVLEMGTPVKIAAMAEDLIRLSGKVPGHDIMIVFEGLRPGEKIHEELISEGEDVGSTRHKQIKVLRSSGPRTEGDQDTGIHEVKETLNSLILLAETHDASAIRKRLHEMVPEYVIQESDAVL